MLLVHTSSLDIFNKIKIIKNFSWVINHLTGRLRLPVKQRSCLTGVFPSDIKITGKNGIRTRGVVKILNALAMRRLKPLSHLSI